MTTEELVPGSLLKGITPTKEGMHKKVWNVLGHTYFMKTLSESSFAFETFDPPGTGVPPHVHPTQDEHIYVLEGLWTVYLDGQWATVGPGDTVRLPRNIPHAYYNRSESATRGLFWVSPAGRLAQLFNELHNLQDIAEVVRLSALHDIKFLPPGSVDGA